MDDDDLRDEINFDQSRVWRIITDLFVNNLSEVDPRENLKYVDVFVTAGCQLGARCVKAYAGCAIRPFDNETLTKIVLVLTR